MKKTRHLFFVITMLFCLSFGAISTQAAAATTTTSVKTTVKNGWKKESAGWCYYVKGKKVTNQLKKISGATYYFGSNGVRKTGWYTVKSGNTYKAINASLMKKTDSVIKGQKISTSLTTEAQKKAAINKLYTYTKKNYKYGRIMGQFSKGKSLSYAQQTMLTGKGNCYGFAATFAVLATGLPVRVCWGTSTAFNKSRAQLHGWTEIKIGNTWYIFDTNAAAYSKRSDVKWYMQKASSAAMKKTYTKKESEDIVL